LENVNLLGGARNEPAAPERATSMDDEFEVLRNLAQTPDLLEQAARTAGTSLQRQAGLREQYDAELVRAALLLTELRLKARRKFTRADQMWFDRTGLEQSTTELIARHKARRFETCPGPIFDLCCGIGSDSIALASLKKEVVSVDQSAAACLRTTLNAAVYGVGEFLRPQAAEATSLKLSGELVHIDPDRRAGKHRAFRLEDYAPSLEFLQQLTQRTLGGAIKLSPASNFGGKFGHNEIELISLEGECKEATVWYGALSGSLAMRATVLPSGFTLAGNPWEFRPHVGPLQRYLYDPDPAIVRSGLLDVLVQQQSVQRLDATEEYLTSELRVATPAMTGFEVLANLPNNDREIRKAIRSMELGELEIKSRHVPTNVEAMRKKMTLTGSGKAVLIIARLDGRTRALICKRIA